VYRLDHMQLGQSWMSDFEIGESLGNNPLDAASSCEDGIG